MSASEEEEEDDAYYDLAQPTVTTSRSAASTIILNRLDDLEFSLTGCDYDHTERDRRRAVAKLTDAAARNPLPPVWRAAKRLLTPKDLRYLLKGVLPKSLTPKELGSIVLALAPDGRVDSRDFAVFYGELGAIEQARRNIGIKERGMSSSLLKERSRRASPDKKWSPDTAKVPEKGTRAYYEWRARQKTRLKMREEKFFGGKRRFWGAAGQRPPTTFTPGGEASLDRRARTLRSAFLKLLAAALDYDRVGEGAKGLDVLSAPMPCDEAARLLFDLFRVHIDDHEAVALSLAFPSSVAEDAVDCAALRDYFLTLARHGLARAKEEDMSEPEVMAFDDESASFQPQSPGQALDEETASRSLASLAEPEVMAFDDDESEVMTTEGGAELLSLA